MSTERLLSADELTSSDLAVLATRIQRRLAGRIGLLVEVDQIDGAIVLTGRADSSRARKDAERIAESYAPDRRIVNRIRVAPDRVAATAEQANIDAGTESVDIAPLEPAAEPDENGASFPPTDPVVTLDEHARVEVLGGFTPTSMTSVDVEPSAEDALPGDEALADAVRRELHEDAATTHLTVHVLVRRG